MFGLQVCLSSLGLDIHSDMVLLRNGMSGLNLSRLSLDVQFEAVLSRLRLDIPSLVVLPELGAVRSDLGCLTVLLWMSGMRLNLSNLSLDVSSDRIWSVVACLEIVWSMVACLAHLEWKVRGCLV